MGNPSTIRRLKDINRTFKPDILFLMETKQQDTFIKDKLQSLNFPNYFSVPPVGLSGGLSLFWRDSVNLDVLKSSPNIIDVEIKLKGSASFVSFIYGAPEMENRAAFWDSVSQLGRGSDIPWLLTGDFNDILCNEEKAGGPARWEGSFTSFRSFVSQNGLWDLKHSGNHLSWRGTRYTHFIRSRLDRAMANCGWAEAFPMGRSKYLRFEGSDHRPLLTFFNDSRTRKKGLFRFNRTLTENPEVTDLVEGVWNLDPLRSVVSKLNACRQSIIQWTKERNRKSNILISESQATLDELLSAASPDLPRIEAVTKTLNDAYREEEAFWRQRSRIQWLKNGDRNTGFFHAATRQRRMQNSFSVLEDENGVAVFEEKQIATVIADFYKGLFTSNGNQIFSTVEQVIERKITPEMNSFLTTIPSPAEIREAAFSINGGKAPGPDGFSAKFYQAYWHIIGEDVSRDIRLFFETSTLNPVQNQTHIRMIPKITGPRKVADYRPIALCNSHYKIIAKILTRRLKPLLPHLISGTQSAFVQGRAITDNVLITHETLHFLRTSEAKKFCSMAIKTDMSKAYDRIEWGFLRAILTKFGFDSTWISWIMACVETVSYSFLVNGSPQGNVSPSRGLRQGDPLSPYLFILCTEMLAGLCEKAQNQGRLRGIRVARGCPLITHLLFADDTMFFCQSSASSVSTLKEIISTYEEVSGQQINYSKSSITFSAKTPGEVKRRVKTDLNIESEGGIGKYLGLPELFGRKKRDIFASIVDRIRQRIGHWSTRFLSGAGKQILLRAVLAAMPSYAMSCFKLPSSLCKQIQALLTRFWWDANTEKRKMCWVAWSTLTLPKFEGGLGFRDLETFNDALLAKIGWRITRNPTSLVAQVLLGKYCKHETFWDCLAPSNASHGWRSILAGREILKQGTGWEVGNGEAIYVWSEPWLSLASPLTPIGPPTEASALLKVSDLLCPLTNTWQTEAIQLHIPQYEAHIHTLMTSSVSHHDRRVWLYEKSGEYTTKSGYNLACTTKSEQREQPLEWQKCIWSLKVSPKIKDFLWRVAKKAIPVSANLETRGLPAFPCKRCGGIEDDLHTFLLCPLAQEVWTLAPLTPQPQVSIPSLFYLLKTGAQYVTLPPTGLTTPLWPWILWRLWKARNLLVFENRSLTGQEVIRLAIQDAKEWEAAQEVVASAARNQPSDLPMPPSVENEKLVCFVDAAWDATTQNCGIAGVFKGQDHRRHQGFRESRRHVGSALVAEALAVRRAVLEAFTSNADSLRVFSDSQTLVKILNAKSSLTELNNILIDVYYFSNRLKVCSFSHISRLGNVEADLVAKSALLDVNSSLPSGG